MDSLLSAAVEQVALAPDGCPLGQLWNFLGAAAEEAGVQLAAPAVRTALWRLLTEEPGLRFTLPRAERLSRNAKELESVEAAEEAGVVLFAARDLQDAAVGLYDWQITRFSISDTQRKALGLIGAAGQRGALQSDLAVEVGSENRNFFYVIKVLEQRGLVVKHPLVVKKVGGSNHFTSHVSTNLLHLTRFAPPNVGRGSKMTDGKSSAHGAGPGQVALGEEELAVLDDSTHFARICAQLSACAGQQADETQLKAVLGLRGQHGHRLWRRLKPALAKRGHVEEFLARTAGDKAVKCIKLLKPWHGGESAMDEDEEGREAARGPHLARQVAELSIDRQLLREVVAAGSEGLTTVQVDAALRLNMKRNEQRMRELEARYGVKKHAVNQGRMMTSRFTAPELLLRQFRDSIAPLVPPGGWLGAVAEAIEAGLDEGEPFPWSPQGHWLAAPAPAAASVPLPERGCEEQAQLTDAQVLQLGAIPGSTVPAAGPAAEVPPPADTAPAAGPRPQQQPLLILSETLSLPVAASAPPAGSKRDRGPAALGSRRFTLGAQQRHEWVAEIIAARGFMLASEMPRYFKERGEAAGDRKATLPDRKTCDRLIKRGQKEGTWQVLSINFPASAFGSLQNRTHTVLAAPGTQPDEAFVDAVYQHYISYKRRTHGGNNLEGQAEQQEMLGKELPVVELQKLVRTLKRGGRRRSAAAASSGEEGSGAAGSSDNEGLPVVSNRSDALKIMQSNGYQTLRVPRLRLVHSVACHLAGLAPDAAAQQGQAQAQKPTLAAPMAAGSAAATASGVGPGASGAAVEAAAAETVTPEVSAAQRVFIMSCLPGPRSKRGVQQVDLGQDSAVARRVVTSQAIWEALSVPQFLEVVGSLSTDPQEVSRLAASGRTVGQLTGEELDALCGGEGESPRAKNRLMQLLEIAHRMGLVASVMPLGPSISSFFSAGGSSTVTSTYAVATQLHIQEPAALAGTEGGGGSASVPHTLTFDLTSPTAAAAYWDHLQYVVARHGTFRAATERDPLGRCFPFSGAPEASFERAFAHRRDVTHDQMEVLDAFLQGEDARRLSSTRCRQLADQLGLPYQAVLAFVAEHKHPTQRLGRLAVVRAELLGAPLVGPHGEPNIIERRRAQQRREYERQRIKRLQARFPEGIPPEKLVLRTNTRSDQPRQKAQRAKAGVKRKSGQEGAAKALLPAEEPSEEDEACGEEAQVDQSALLPHPSELAPSLRKKRWHRHEDRELLTSWAGFLSLHGLEKVLLWRVVPGRPANLKHFTLKRRLKELQLHQDLGEKVAEVRQLALRLHALMLQGAAEAEAEQRQDQEGEVEGQAAALPESAAAPRASSKHKSVAAETPAAKRARAEAVSAAEAAPAAAGGGDDKGGSGDAVLPALAMLQALLPADFEAHMLPAAREESATVKARLAVLVEEVVAAAPKQHKEKLPQRPGPTAPAQPRRRGPRPLSATAEQRLHLFRGTHVAARPASLLKHWAAALRSSGRRALGPAGSANAAGAEEEEAAGGAAGEQPGPAVTAALALAQSLLFLGAKTGILGAGYETALTGRFAAPDILRAFELLRRQGALVPGASRAARLHLHLSERWRAQLQCVGYPASIFKEAAATAATLHQHRHLDVPAMAAAAGGQGGVEGGLAALQPAATAGAAQQEQEQQQGDVSGGVVAELLGRMAAGQQVLRLYKVKAIPRLSAVVAGTGEASGGGSQGQHTAELEVHVHVRAVPALAQGDGGSGGSAAGGSSGGAAGAPARAGAMATVAAGTGASAEGEGEAEGMAEAAGEAGESEGGVTSNGGLLGGGGLAQKLQYTRQELVLFQPSLAASSDEARDAAQAACRGAAANAGIAASAFDAALASLRAAGATGLSQQQLAVPLQQAAAGGRSQGKGSSIEVEKQLAELLLLHGLARAVCCFDGKRYTAVEHSQGLLSFPFLPRPAPSASQEAAGEKQHAQQQEQQEREWRDTFGREVRHLAAALSLPAGGQLQPCLDVPVRPWVDHHGRLNAQLWDALVHKVLVAAALQPGLPEEAFLDELSVLAPQHARELLSILEASRLLKVQPVAVSGGSTSSNTSGTSPTSVLDACFAPSSVAPLQARAAGGDSHTSGAVGAASEEIDEGQQQQQHRFYFAAPAACFSTHGVLPPLVLLPLMVQQQGVGSST